MSDEKIYIYHTNDIHSDLTYWPRIAQELQEKRMIREQHGDSVLVFDIGDAVDRVHPLTEATDGQAITKLLNQGQYDAVTIGNNEGITNSKEELDHLYNRADFSVILTNLFDQDSGERPSWASPYKIYPINNIKIGVFGLTTQLEETYKKLGWKVTNPTKQAQEFLRRHEKEADFWILLSHLGINEDRTLAKLFSIPLIIGGHTHHVLEHGQKVATSTLAGAGQFGQWLGEIVLGFAHGKLRVEDVHLINASEIDAVKNEEKIIANYQAKGHQLLRKQTIAEIPQKLTSDWSSQTNMADISLEAVADFTGTKAAVLNAGLFLKDINQGIVTADDLHQAIPHPIRVMHCKVKGHYLIKFVQKIKELDERLTNQPVRGFGFRGKVFGKICLKGLKNEKDQVFFAGEPIQPEQEYELAMIDYFSFLPFFDILNVNSEQTIMYPDFLRTIVGNYLTQKFPKY